MAVDDVRGVDGSRKSDGMGRSGQAVTGGEGYPVFFRLI